MPKEEVLYIPVNKDLKKKVSIMAKEDDLPMTIFVRFLLSAEWEKREEKKITLQPVEE